MTGDESRRRTIVIDSTLQYRERSDRMPSLNLQYRRYSYRMRLQYRERSTRMTLLNVERTCHCDIESPPRILKKKEVLTLSYDEEFKDDHTPVGFLITFRCYGTWLHGDPRGSVDRFHNIYGTPELGPERARVKYERKLMTRPPVRLNAKRRAASETGVREACKKRGWKLWTVNARTNHVHSVVTANCNSKKVRSTLKAYATKTMRETGCWQSDKSPWSDRGGRTYLWTEKELYAAIDYVLYEQGEPLPEELD